MCYLCNCITPAKIAHKDWNRGTTEFTFGALYGWQHLVDIIGDFSWTKVMTFHGHFLVTFRGQFRPQEVLFLGDFSWTFFG